MNLNHVSVIVQVLA
jgi:hypothetical protein